VPGINIFANLERKSWSELKAEVADLNKKSTTHHANGLMAGFAPSASYSELCAIRHELRITNALLLAIAEDRFQDADEVLTINTTVAQT
jgi:hypothetical protein